MARRMLSDAQVKDVKKLLIEGHSVANVARMYQQSADTISRIKRGVSRQSAWVEGEEVLRPAVGERLVLDEAKPRELGEMVEDEMMATLRRMREVQEEMAAGQATGQKAEAEKPVFERPPNPMDE